MCNTNKSIKESSRPLDALFDSSAELTKTLVRELFHFSNQALNGLAAAIVSSNLNAKPRMKKQLSDVHQSDKLFEIYLNKQFLLNTSRTTFMDRISIAGQDSFVSTHTTRKRRKSFDD